ncbi:YwqG family protein [Labrys sp. ZIDIC5]|uniref:YwqG family protein n=1 Tax=Labrys sedimenti TaxID=3106036 RepID=UPI002ACA1589|nr:YwqG family protein [Labrys sp. ZIDIC5]MDZ5453270.1 YwqG family protein [Labrys sp. ZIDIC5]
MIDPVPSPRQLLENVGLGAHADRILPHELPAIAILLGTGTGDTGQSRIGGLPDLPPTLAWPHTAKGEAMEFALQLDLAELPPAASELPPAGMLYVFVGLDEPATNIEHRILLYTGTAPLHPAALPADIAFANDMFADVEPHRLEFTEIRDFPRWATRDFSAVTRDMSEDEHDTYNEEFMWSLEPNTASPILGKLFGHAAGIGSDPREDAYVVREVNPKWLYNARERAKLDLAPARNWRHLLTIDSCMTLGLGIWDAGYLQFLQHQNDLEKLDFSRVYAAVESS